MEYKHLPLDASSVSVNASTDAASIAITPSLKWR